MITARLGKILPRYKMSKKLYTHTKTDIEIVISLPLTIPTTTHRPNPKLPSNP